MKTMIGGWSISFILLFTTSVWAQRASEHITFADGNVCEVTQHSEQEMRTTCSKGGSYGHRADPDGKHYELKYERSLLRLGAKTWKAKRLPPFKDELPPIVVVPDGPMADAPPMGDVVPFIDVAVFYTPRVRTAQGGLANTQALIASAVANTNNSYANSGVLGRIRLVLAQELAYVETDLSTDLSRFQRASDGFIDEVHALRTQYSVDVNTLFTEGAGECGVGYFMSYPSPTFAGTAFNVVARTCAAGYLSYAHEVGHNQGLAHDPANAGFVAPGTYHYGYQDTGGQFRTVMSYGGATRIQMFSSATRLYNSRPTGNATQDNSRRLGDTWAAVAAFKSPVSTTVLTPTGPPIPKGN